MPVPIRASNRAGLSLLEAVVAVAIVGMTSVGALEAAGADMRSAERSRRAIVAEALATTRLDLMELFSERELQSLADSVQTGKFPAPLDEYSWKVTSAPVGEQAGVYDIRVAITWTTGTYVVRTYAYRRPPLAARQ